MEKVLKKSPADYTEIRLEDKEYSVISFRKRELEDYESATEIGGNIRVLINGGWGIASFNNIRELQARLDQACECAKAVGGGEVQLAPVEPIEDSIKVDLEEDFRELSLEEKRQVLEEYKEIFMEYDKKLKTSLINYSDRFSKVYYANSEGTFIYEERPHVQLYFRALAKKGSTVQRGSESFAKAKGFEVIRGNQELVHKAAKRAIDLLSAKPIKGGKYTVVLDPMLAGVFAHEAFGHLSEADHIHENPKFQEIMVLGKKFGSDILSIGDDGSVPGLRGTHKYDDEGVRTRKNYLIKDGILVGRLHSRETAAKMGESLTGNARAIDYRFAPIVRMTNTFIENGETSFEDMIADIEEGIYACSFVGGNTMSELFTFSSAYAYMIRNGKVEEMIRDVVLSGNLFQTLKGIDCIGNDFQWEESAGGCGKGGQSPLPTTEGSPHIRIQNVTVGGRQ